MQYVQKWCQAPLQRDLPARERQISHRHRWPVRGLDLGTGSQKLQLWCWCTHLSWAVGPGQDMQENPRPAPSVDSSRGRHEPRVVKQSSSKRSRDPNTVGLLRSWMWLWEGEACSPTHSLGTGPCEFQESLSYRLTLLTTSIKITSSLSRQNIPCSVAKLCLTLCDPMDCSTPGFPVLHYFPKFAQIHIHWVSDAV